MPGKRLNLKQAKQEKNNKIIEERVTGEHFEE